MFPVCKDLKELLSVAVQVAELKQELKLRGLPVSGTKTDLIERLKPFQDSGCAVATPPSTAPPASASSITSVPMEISGTPTTPAIVLPMQQVQAHDPSMATCTPPVSPVPADPPGVKQDPGVWEVKAEGAAPVGVPEEKDRRLHEKERQIEELMRKLEQEQKLVEALKMQLELEKRSGIADPVPQAVADMSGLAMVLNSTAVKPEVAVASNCPTTAASILGSPVLSSLPTVLKLDDVTVSPGPPLKLQAQTQLLAQIQPAQLSSSPQILSQPQSSPKMETQSNAAAAAPGLQKFFIRHQGAMLSQPQTLLSPKGQPGAQILLPVSLPSNPAAIQLPSTTVSLQVRWRPAL